MSVSQGRICTSDPSTTRELQELCSNAVRGDILKQGRELLLRRSNGEPPLRLLVLPLSCSLSDSLWGGDIPVAVFFFDAVRGDGDKRQDVTPILCNSYKCTLAEARNAMLYADGATAVQVGDMVGIDPETVKTHLKHARRKLGVKNKAELAQLIQTLRSPVRR